MTVLMEAKSTVDCVYYYIVWLQNYSVFLHLLAPVSQVLLVRVSISWILELQIEYLRFSTVLAVCFSCHISGNVSCSSTLRLTQHLLAYISFANSLQTYGFFPIFRIIIWLHPSRVDKSGVKFWVKVTSVAVSFKLNFLFGLKMYFCLA